MDYLRISLRKNRFIDFLEEHFEENHENTPIFCSIMLYLVKEDILDFHFTTCVWKK